LVKAWGALGSITIIATLALILIPSTPEAAAGADTICSGILAAGTYMNIIVPTFCSIGNLVIVNGNVIVQNGATVALVGATIGGNVELDTDSRLVAFVSAINGNLVAGDGTRVWLNGNNTIGGNLVATNCFSVGNYNPGIVDFIIGDIVIDNCDLVRLRFVSVGVDVTIMNVNSASSLADSLVGGDLDISNNSGFVYRAARNTVGGDLTVDNNDTSTSTLLIPGFISGNFISGNLDCGENDPAPVFGIISGPNVVTGVKSGQCTGL